MKILRHIEVDVISRTKDGLREGGARGKHQRDQADVWSEHVVNSDAAGRAEPAQGTARFRKAGLREGRRTGSSVQPKVEANLHFLKCRLSICHLELETPFPVDMGKAGKARGQPRSAH